MNTRPWEEGRAAGGPLSAEEGRKATEAGIPIVRPLMNTKDTEEIRQREAAKAIPDIASTSDSDDAEFGGMFRGRVAKEVRAGLDELRDSEKMSKSEKKSKKQKKDKSSRHGSEHAKRKREDREDAGGDGPEQRAEKRRRREERRAKKAAKREREKKESRSMGDD